MKWLDGIFERIVDKKLKSLEDLIKEKVSFVKENLAGFVDAKKEEAFTWIKTKLDAFIEDKKADIEKFIDSKIEAFLAKRMENKE